MGRFLPLPFFTVFLSAMDFLPSQMHRIAAKEPQGMPPLSSVSVQTNTTQSTVPCQTHNKSDKVNSTQEERWCVPLIAPMPARFRVGRIDDGAVDGGLAHYSCPVGHASPPASEVLASAFNAGEDACATFLLFEQVAQCTSNLLPFTWNKTGMTVVFHFNMCLAKVAVPAGCSRTF